jgi:hypothetical protein
VCVCVCVCVVVHVLVKANFDLVAVPLGAPAKLPCTQPPSGFTLFSEKNKDEC